MRSILIFVTIFTATFSLASTVGVSTHPFVSSNQAFTTEFNSFHSYGEGLGLTGRYFRKLNELITLDAGLGLATNDRPSRFFVGADYLLYPDYDNQPRISLKSTFENVQIDDSRFNIIGIAPTLSKSIVVNNHEVFPFVAIPLSLGLNSSDKSYRFFPELNFGATTEGFEVGDYKNLVGSLEFGFDMSKGGSSIAAGLTYPLK